VAWLAGYLAVPHTRAKAVRARSRTSLGAPGARSGHRGLYIPAANDPHYLRYRLASDHRRSRAATEPSYRTPPAQKVDILHKKLSLNGALCAKPAKAMRASSIFKSRVCERLNFIDEPLEVYPLLSNFIATNPKRPFA
jgi:hypothetical protein